ncbi:TPA: FRG domain-containing protein [Clostridium perfringens]|uniref:FRG domain-containing protein n=1 Tax=Clostridium perfringens TaxID=1502 RepID=UPI002973CA12|nr:FRG domain-containing protein [Clostridium perfringens]
MGKEYIIRSLSEYIKIVKELTDEIQEKNPRYEVWFRGQEKWNYELSPKGLRTIKKLTPCQYMREGEDIEILPLNDMLNDFKRKAIDNLDYKPTSLIEWCIIAQHYGLPTKLLDWTTNALVGLYFALPSNECLKKSKGISKDDIVDLIKWKDVNIDDIENMSFEEVYNEKLKFNEFNNYKYESVEEFSEIELENSAVVYIMSPNLINENTIGIDEIIYTKENEKVEEEMEYFLNASKYGERKIISGISDKATNDFPICINCNEIDKRIKFQSGCFTLHGIYCAPLDFYNVIKKDIHKLCIPYKYVEKIRSELDACGINRYFIYQDLNSLSEILYNKQLKIFKNIE